MVLTDARYFLRILSGEREGESIPIPSQGLTVGRRPDNDLQIAETSVSGRHAELLVDDRGVTLRDLGSTNGTRVGAERVEERRLAHGDEVSFGSARATFVDRAFADDPAAGAPEPAGAGEAVHTLDGGRVAPGGRKGLAGALVALVVIGGGTAAALRFLAQGAEDHGPTGTPAAEIPGNRIADGAFEADGAAAWEASDAAPVSFFRDRSFRATGDAGFGCELAPGEWARAVSPAVALRPRRGIALSASVAADGGVEACAGIELSSSTGAEPAFVAWAEAVRPEDGFRDVRLEAPALPGYDRARVVLEARAGERGGTARADDVALVEREGEDAPAVALEDDRLHLIGARTGVLVHAAEVVLSGLRVREAGRAEGAEGEPRWTAAVLSASPKPDGATLAFGDAGPDAVLAFQWHLGDEPFLATTGSDGFRAYGSGIEGARADALLLGRGGRLIRIAFPREVALSGTIGGGSLHVEAALEGAAGADLQLSFREQRGQATGLAAEARDAERAGDVGRALDAWNRLLDEFPFEGELVSEAETARSRILQQGHAELARLAGDVERARFFGLGPLFLRSEEDARALARRFRGSEVEEQASALADAAASEARRLGGDVRAFERARLEAVLSVLERREWSGLADHVRGALEERGDG